MTTRRLHDGYEWDVFLSHNGKQKPWVRQVVEQWRDLGLKVFFDEDCIRPGEPVDRGIERGLTGSRQVVLIISPEAVASRWVALETSVAFCNDPDGSQLHLVPVKLMDINHTKIPSIVRRLNWIDLADPTMRLNRYHYLLKSLGIRKKPSIPAYPGWDDTPDDQEVPIPVHAATDGVEQGSVMTRTGTLEVELTIERDFDAFTVEEETRVVEIIRQALKIPGQIRIISKQRGSVRLTIELTPAQAESLLWLVRSGEFASLGLTDARIENEEWEPRARSPRGVAKPPLARKVVPRAVGTSMTKKEIVEKISQDIGLTQLKTKDIVQRTLDAIIQTLVSAGRIELRNFGVFEVKRRVPRTARNPSTGDKRYLPPKNVITFKPDKKLEELARKLPAENLRLLDDEEHDDRPRTETHENKKDG